MNGWNASFRAPALWFSPWLGVKGDASGEYRSDPPFEFKPHVYFSSHRPLFDAPAKAVGGRQAFPL
jgi:hypothetical protein